MLPIPFGPLDTTHHPLLTWNPAATGPEGFLLIAGPCVIESLDLCLEIGATVKAAAQKLGVPYIFKASFDKANRSSANSARGLGIDKGLDILAAVREQLHVPVTTDIHESDQATSVSHFVDLLQIPAFLCRQTDLLLAAGQTGKPVSIKKGQFMAPWEMSNALQKVGSTNNPHTLLIERGTFFGYNRLVNDMTGIPQMQRLTETGTPVLMDATHSTQLPGGLGHATAGQREFVPLLARAATAAGANGLFIEVHPTPEKSPSDAATILPLNELEKLLTQCLAIRAAIT
ncbi:MAG TPA: 3-deoxy-8-phosphooctulonate synthase [Phycisphaerae bacterium]|nr:3-deoxy-8-phosphooctulonate synthase [Phycisphaerae bacterium]